MPQTTAQTSLKGAVIEYSTNGSAWTDISGYSNEIDPGPVARNVGQAYTAAGDNPLLAAGKLKAQSIKVKLVYTEEDAGAWKIVLASILAGTAFYLRFGPKGGNASGEYQYTTGAGLVESVNLPAGNFEDGKPVLCDFVLIAPVITQSKVT